MLIRNIY